jgi:nucleoside-diphosphate-sugar epimerase
MSYLSNKPIENCRSRTILVTGATGFIGTALCNHLIRGGNQVIGITRKEISSGRTVIVKDIAEFDGWRGTLRGVNAVVHLAGRAHILKDRAVDPLEKFRRVNTRATITLAENAALVGVKRFVFISSIGVNGNVTDDRPFSVVDAPQPPSPFARSKYEAELALHEISRTTGMEVVIIRPPLVYGPNAPGNFQSMMHWLASNVPLPLGAVTKNRRSFVSLDNLVDLIAVCIDHSLAANQTFLVSDGEDLSTTDLLRRLSRALRKKAVLLPIPPSLLRLLAKAIGKGDVAQRLLDDLRVDIQHTCDTLGWRPPLSVEAGLAKAATGLNPH